MNAETCASSEHWDSEYRRRGLEDIVDVEEVEPIFHSSFLSPSGAFKEK